VIRNAVNFPSIPPEEFARIQPFVELAGRLGTFIAQMNEDRATSIGIRYYGEIGEARTDVIVNAVLAGFFKPILEAGVTMVNARAIAADRGIEVIESRSSRTRDYVSLISVKLQTSAGERIVEGAVVQRKWPRLVTVDDIRIEAPLEGTMVVICNTDQPGVIGQIGTILGKHNVNIANFALGRDTSGRAVGVVIVDETAPIPAAVLEEVKNVPGIREARIVRV
jgi:D-3-phosphoglycerate dehydrogenase